MKDYRGSCLGASLHSFRWNYLEKTLLMKLEMRKFMFISCLKHIKVREYWVDQNILDQWFPKWSWILKEIQIHPHPRPAESESPGVGLRMCFIELSGDSNTYSSLRTSLSSLIPLNS